MKKSYHIFSLIAMVATLLSCSKEESNWDAQPYAKLEIAGDNLQNEYVAEQSDILHIEAPEFKQQNKNLPLTYEWQVEDKIVSKEKELNYECATFGKFNAQLKVFNGESYFLHTFTINVRYKYLTGLYILASLNGKTIVSYEPENIEGKSFVLNSLESNTHINLNAQPKAFYFSVSHDKPKLYVATENPNMIHRLDANLMFAEDKIDTGDEIIESLRDDGSFSQGLPSSLDLRAIVNKRLAEFKSSSNYLINTTQQRLESNLGSMELFKTFLTFGGVGTTFPLNVLFDNQKGRLLAYKGGFDSVNKELLAGTFTNFEAVALLRISQDNEMMAILKSKTDSKYYLYWVDPQSNTPEVRDSREITSVTENSRFIASAKRNLLYYSVGNKIFAYNIDSKGNLPHDPLFNLDSDQEQVADMYINTDENKLYIATNDNSSAMKGSVYCFDIVNRTLLWKKKNITGEIIQLDYRYL